MTIQAGSPVLASDFPAALTLIPQPNYPTNGSTDGGDDMGVAGSTTMFLGQLFIPAHITINTITIYVSSVSVAGTFKLVIYSADGQTKILEQVTASISSGGLKSTTVSPAVTLPRGVYYFGIVPVSTGNATMNGWLITDSYGANLVNAVSGKPLLSGYVTVTAGTPPSSFTPSSLTAQTRCLMMRLDNA